MKTYVLMSICFTCFSAPVVDEVNENKEEQALSLGAFDEYLDTIKLFRDYIKLLNVPPSQSKVDKVVGVDQSLKGCAMHSSSSSIVEVIECECGLYNDSRWPADISSMLPQDLMGTIENLNITEKGELINFMSDWYHGRIKKPENKAEVVELIKEKLPTLYEKIHALNTTFYGKFFQLKPETQDLLRSWRDKAISLEGSTPAESAAKRLQLLRDVALSVQSMSNETKEDIRSQFPMAVNLTEGFGFTILTTIAMIVQKMIESFNAVTTVTTLPPECATSPLD